MGIPATGKSDSSTFGYYQFVRQVKVYFNTNSLVS